MALPSAGGGCAWAACSRARISVRSCSAAISCAGLRSTWQPSGSTCRASSCGSTRSARVRKPAWSGSATAGGDQPLQRGQRARVQLLGGQRRGQAAGVGDQPRHQLLAEPVIGARRRRNRNGRARRRCAPRPRPAARRSASSWPAVDPVRHQRARAHPRRIGAERAQVAQPGEAVRGGAQQRRGAGVVEPARPQRDRAAAQRQLALQQIGAARRIARPRVAHRQRRRVRHPRHAQAGQPRHAPPHAAQPAAHAYGPGSRAWRRAIDRRGTGEAGPS